MTWSPVPQTNENGDYVLKRFLVIKLVFGTTTSYWNIMMCAYQNNLGKVSVQEFWFVLN